MYKLMWSLRVCALVCMCAAVAATTAAELRCVHPRCVGTGEEGNFFVEDHHFRVTRDGWDYDVSVDCEGWRTLESLAMPSFTSLVHMSSVKLSSCPPPTNGSFADVFTALNVTLLQDDGTFGNLSLEYVPLEPPLAERHFVGLENIRRLKIFNSPHNASLLPAASFLVKLRSLQSLDLTNVRLSAGELDDLPPTLRSGQFHNTGLERLPKVFSVLSDLQNLVVNEEGIGFTAIFEDPPLVLRELELSSTNTTLRLDEFPTVLELHVTEWSERHPTALRRCDELRSLVLRGLGAEALPERWVAACPRLDVIYVEFMRNVASLPPKLLEGASELRRLFIINGVLETLPEGLLDEAPNLSYLLLYGNRLHTILSGTFLGPRALNGLDLSRNRLQQNSLDALAPLCDLDLLNLSNNPSLGDLCDYNGYSPLVNSTRLTSLSLSGTNITRICRDWRENMTFLEKLDLEKTQISELRYDDFQYKRDATVSFAQVLLDDIPITSVQFTEDDYKRALTAPFSGTWIHLRKWPECDCRMYWTLLVAERARHALWAFPPPCMENYNLTDVCAPTINAAPSEVTTEAS